MRVFLETLGCKLNQAESEMILRDFLDKGIEQTDRLEEADIYVLNTCTVTGQADAKARKLLKRARRLNPELNIVATGCYVERGGGDLASLADLLIPNGQKPDLVSHFENSNCVFSNKNHHFYRTRTFIKIQAGCKGKCSYCIVPRIRPEENIPPEEVLSQIRKREEGGYKEAVLTGTEIGAYNYKGVTFKGLLEKILDETNIERLRISSLQPQEIDEEMLDYWQDGRLCRHFHLSLQSGSNSVLRRMCRCYTRDDFAQAVFLIRSKVPGVALSTDVIVGFPGESDEEFLESYEFCQAMEFDRMHVFPFSPRPGTAAGAMGGKVDERTKKERAGLMLELARRMRRKSMSKSIGQICRVLVEQKRGEWWSGLSDNYFRVYFNSDSANLTNQVIKLKIVRLLGDGLWGEVLPGES